VNRHAFTLVELLAATALTAILMVGVLAVVADLGVANLTSSSTAAKPSPEAGAMEALVRLLREDLVHATAVRIPRPNEVVLVGYAALDGNDRERTHRPVLVAYRLADLDGRRWLIRRQSALDVLSNQGIRYDLVCGNVTRFELVRSGGDSGADATSAPAPVLSLSTVGLSASDSTRGTASADAWDTGGVATAATGPTAAAPGSKTAASTEGGAADDESVLFNGLFFFKKYLPEWAQQELADGTSASGPTTSAQTAASASSASRTTTSVPLRPGAEAEPDAAAHRPPSGIVWRLRLWTTDTDAPAAERIVTMQLN